MALRGVRVQAASAAHLLRRNLLIYGVGGHVGDFAVGAPAGDVERWDDADGFAHLEVADVGADGGDYAGGFVAEAAGEFGFLQVGVVAEHHFGAVEAEGFDVDLHFIGSGGGDVDVFEFQDAGVGQ